MRSGIRSGTNSLTSNSILKPTAIAKHIGDCDFFSSVLHLGKAGGKQVVSKQIESIIFYCFHLGITQGKRS